MAIPSPPQQHLVSSFLVGNSSEFTSELDGLETRSRTPEQCTKPEGLAISEKDEGGKPPGEVAIAFHFLEVRGFDFDPGVALP
ncbi:unnamed protein product [Arctogadus glacialis]